MRIRKKIKTRMENRKNRHVKLYDIGHSFTIIMMHPRPGNADSAIRLYSRMPLPCTPCYSRVASLPSSHLHRHLRRTRSSSLNSSANSFF